MLQTYSTITQSRKSIDSLNPTLSPESTKSDAQNTCCFIAFPLNHSPTNLSFLISYSTNQQIDHAIKSSKQSRKLFNQKTAPSISISLPTSLSGRLSHAVYQTLLINFFETTGCSMICAGLFYPKSVGNDSRLTATQQTTDNVEPM